MAKPNAQRFLARALAVLGKKRTFQKVAPRPWSVDLTWMSGPKMAALNKKFRNKSKPTDVLSFPAPGIFRDQGVLGSLALCETVMRAQAKEHGLTEEMETQILIVHGLLHLLGLDHELGAKEAALMARWERKVLKEVCPSTWVKRSKGRCLKGMILP